MLKLAQGDELLSRTMLAGYALQLLFLEHVKDVERIMGFAEGVPARYLQPNVVAFKNSHETSLQGLTQPTYLGFFYDSRAPEVLKEFQQILKSNLGGRIALRTPIAAEDSGDSHYSYDGYPILIAPVDVLFPKKLRSEP